MNGYVQKARGRGLSFLLTLEQFTILIFQDCFYCGSKPSNRYNVFISKAGKYRNGIKSWMDAGWIEVNGVDRVDNNIGYEISNVVTCCKTCNFAKRNLSQSEFYSWINQLVNFRIK